MKLILKAAIVAAGVLAAGAAQAANAISTTNLNLRTGPSTRYATMGAIPGGAPVTVHGCTSGYGWCRVSYGGAYGWASSRYLAIREGRYRGDFGRNAAMIGIPLIAGIAIGSALDGGYRGHHRYWHHRHGWRDGPGWHGRDGGWRGGGWHGGWRDHGPRFPRRYH
ncbi:MAG: SH3 domain-containing protein [Rhizobiales bacterium]|nr:SH3 domain-containing protein [Hyphomicrobiales bacterium]OJX99422.1 MAG: ligand-binding protein SH3 [Rhizobiales bacterium 63-22]